MPPLATIRKVVYSDDIGDGLIPAASVKVIVA
jgi:hypothetical protein